MKRKKLLSLLCAVAMIFGCTAMSASAAGNELQAGKSYELTGNLRCYVNAMGGIDFADSMLNGITVTVDAQGNAYMTISLGVTHGTIYTVDYIAFVDATNSAPGYYDSSGKLHRDATYTLSRNTAVNSTGSSVHYVDSITFPISTTSLQSTYTLFLYIESNVMGVQFCNGSGTATSGNPGALTPYVATLTVNWGSLTSSAAKSAGRDSNVTYTLEGMAEGQYLLTIPALLELDADTASSYVYQVILADTGLTGEIGLQVSVPDSVTLTCGSRTVAAQSALSDNVLSEKGGILTGVVTLGDQVLSGTWTGRVDFTVSYVNLGG